MFVRRILRDLLHKRVSGESPEIAEPRNTGEMPVQLAFTYWDMRNTTSPLEG